MDKNSVYRTNIIGAGEVGSSISIDMDKNSVYRTNSFYWDTKGNDFLGAIVLPFYGAFVSEEKLQLLGDVSGKKMLEIGCGNGQSLQYLGERQASELWAVDISEKQIEKAKQHLTACGLSAKFICSPMEEECGIPMNYFDFVYSIFGSLFGKQNPAKIQQFDMDVFSRKGILHNGSNFTRFPST